MTDSSRPLLDIPIEAARRIAEDFGYDQVIVYGRRVGEVQDIHGEHVTTYGVGAGNRSAAAAIGDYLKYRVFGWEEPA